MALTAAECVDALEETWASLARLAAGLGDEDWDRPTGCPGWSVKDHVAHVAGLEAALAGRAEPPHRPAGDPPHVRNDLGRYMEVQVDLRRSRPPAAILDELADVTAQRRAQLRALLEEGDDEGREVAGIMGAPTPLGRFVRTRLFDCYTHEQDVRRAVGRPGHAGGAAARHTQGQIVSSLGFVLAKGAGAPDGTTLEVTVTGPLPATATVTVADGRGRVTPRPDPGAAARLTMDGDTFLALGTGRLAGGDALAAGAVGITGDADLARRLLDHLAITP